MGIVAMLKSVTPDRIVKNIKVYDFELDEAHMEKLDMPGSYEYCTWVRLEGIGSCLTSVRKNGCCLPE